MGCSSFSMEKLKKDLEIRQAKRQRGTLPEIGSIVYFKTKRLIGRVVSVNYGKVEIFLRQIGSGELHRIEYKKEWKRITDVPELAKFSPNFAVTAPYRGSMVNGYIVHHEDSKLVVRFKPDPAHSVDKTNWMLGSTHKYDAAALSIGHSGEDRPRNRNKIEIKQDERQMKSCGHAFIYCSSCGNGIWNDPCTCYITRKRKSWHCQQCGTKSPRRDDICCGSSPLYKQTQSNGYPSVLFQQNGCKELI
eukprot:jgi/Bigna1/74421/fgenesh1_pg.29_\